MGLHTLATAFKWLAIVIAADWSAAPITIPLGSGSIVSHQLERTPEDIERSFISLARGMPEKGIPGSIRPQFAPLPMMYGHWGF